MPDGRYLLAVRTVAEPETEGSGEEARQLVQEAIGRAEALLARAREEAETLLREAETRRAEIEKQAYEEGYRRGYAAALEEARREAEEIRLQAQAVLQEARRLREEMIAGAEPELVELALDIARQVVHRQLSVEPETVANVVREAALRLRGRRQLVVLVNPQDAALVHSRVSELRAELGPEATIHVLSDPGIPAGGCRVESEAGQVEATVEGQLERLGRALRELARERAPEEKQEEKQPEAEAGGSG
jgi:flagellar assembly protein FliH